MQHRAFSLARAPASASRGFTLVETLVAVGIAGVLSSIAYPSLESQVMRARRSDALVSLMQAQLAQERYRANHRGYGELGRDRRARDLAVGPLRDRGRGQRRRRLRARRHRHRPAGARHDLPTLRLVVAGGSVVYASGPMRRHSNAAAVNRKCWNQ